MLLEAAISGREWSSESSSDGWEQKFWFSKSVFSLSLEASMFSSMSVGIVSEDCLSVICLTIWRFEPFVC